MMTCLHRELCAEGYVCAQVCEGREGAGGSTGFGGKPRQRKYERERERERDRVEACLAQVSGHCDERNSRCSRNSSLSTLFILPLPLGHHVRRCV
jgi:hypothetical protein